MVVKAKETFEKDRRVKKMMNLKNIIYELKEWQDNMIDDYQNQEKDNRCDFYKNSTCQLSNLTFLANSSGRSW